MKRIVVLLSLIIFVVTGCSVTSLNATTIDTIIQDALDNKLTLANTDGKGYKFYLPRGMSIENQVDYNTQMKYKNDQYYLYVDVIAYYYKTNTTYQETKDAYYSKVIQQDDKIGYVEVIKEENYYKVKVEYNYAKIEANITEENLEEGIVNIIYILSTLQFNDEVLNTLIGENVLDYQEEQIDIFESKREEGNFLDYIEEYDTYDEDKDSEQLQDEDIISASIAK